MSDKDNVCIDCGNPRCLCRQRDEKGRPKAVHIKCPIESEIRVDYSDLSAMQPVAAVDFADVVRFVKDKNLGDLSCDTDAFWAGAAAKCWDEPGSSWHDTIRPAYEEYMAAIKTLNTPPMTVTASTGNAAPPPEETKVCHACRAPFSLASKGWCLLDSNLYFCAEDSKAALEMWDKLRDYFREGSTRLSPEKRAVFVEAEKMPPRDEEAKRRRENLDAAIIRECRAAIMRSRQYPEWPRCKDHDAPMALKCCLPFSGNGKRYAFAGCTEIGCRRTSAPVEVELTGPTARAIGDESWTAPEYRT